MDDSCSRRAAEFWQLRLEPQQSPQKDLIMMFENLLGNIFCHDMERETSDEAIAVAKTDTGIDFGSIDSKIKEALQLMKTSLSFAIRQEVDLLKEKVADLETKIDELKSENRLLREYAPEDILRQIEESSSPNVRSPMIEQAASSIEA